MNPKKSLLSTLLTGALLLIGADAQAALQGRDLDSNLVTFEAYYDTVLDITWLADANYAKTSGHDTDGKMSWSNATDWAAGLSVNGMTGWRLPSIEPINGVSLNFTNSYDGTTDLGVNITSPSSEMSHLFYVSLGNEAWRSSSVAPINCYYCLVNKGPFINAQQDTYWSGSSFPIYSNNGYYGVFEMDSGLQTGNAESLLHYAWAVHDGDIGAAVAAVPEPETYALMLAGLGLVGFAARRQRQF